MAHFEVTILGSLFQNALLLGVFGKIRCLFCSAVSFYGFCLYIPLLHLLVMLLFKFASQLLLGHPLGGWALGGKHGLHGVPQTPALWSHVPKLCTLLAVHVPRPGELWGFGRRGAVWSRPPAMKRLGEIK